MGNPNRKRNILAVLAIILLLGLLVCMIWYDRQSKLSVNEGNQSQMTMSHEQNKNHEREDGRKEESRDYEKGLDEDQEKDQEESELEKSQDTSKDPDALPKTSNHPALSQLEGKETVEDFRSQDNQVVLRSLGGITLGEPMNRQASTASKPYQSFLEKLVSQEYPADQDSHHGYDYGLMFEDIAPFVDFSDITLSQVNQAAAYPQLPQSDYPIPNSPSAIFNDLSDLGIDYVSLASGHIYDKGASAIKATVNNANNADLQVGGAFSSQEDMDTARIEEMNGMNIAFLSYTLDLNGNLLADGETYLASFFTQNMIAEEVAAVKEMADAVVVNIYTSEEMTQEPSEHIRSTFQMIADAGANVIIGHNPNALQAFQWLNNQSTLVLFSQGSFLTSAQEMENRLSGIFEFKIIKEGDTVEVDLPKFMPTVTIGSTDEYYRVVPLADFDKYEIADGQELWDNLNQQINGKESGIEIVSHLETSESKEEIDKHR